LLSGLPYGTFLISATYTNSGSSGLDPGTNYNSIYSSIQVVVKVTLAGVYVNYSVNQSTTWVVGPLASGSAIVIPVAPHP
jgi:hypothetical protein